MRRGHIGTAYASRDLHSSITQFFLDKSAYGSIVKLHPNFGAFTMQHVLVVDTDSDQDIIITQEASIDDIMAYHEAGHTVAALVLGMELKEVSINPPRTRVRLPLLTSFHDFIDIERDAVYTLAGEMAEKMIHDEDLHVPVDDRAHLQELAAILYEDDPNGAAEWTAQMEITTEALVEKHSSDIESVAMKLLSDPVRRFSGNEIRVLLKR
jgi:hypothetical protein